jgi:uncharacterized protein (TIGR03437 family)
MVPRWVAILAVSCAFRAFAQTPTVGGGAPSTSITTDFQEAYGRGNFSKLVGTPLGNVVSFGSTGLIQLFPGVSSTALTYALIKPDTTTTANVEQMLAGMYAYYATLPVSVIGFPTADTADCPAVQNAGTGNTCTWQPFTNDYALFAYTQPVNYYSKGLAVGDPFYTLWQNLGGISVLGSAIAAQTQVVSPFGTVAIKQPFDQSVVYEIQSGSEAGQTLAVIPPFYAVYAANSADAGYLGLPIGSEQTLTGGVIQQLFERGAIEYNPATGTAVAQPPVGAAAISAGASVSMTPGTSLSVHAILQASNGSSIDQRPVVWTTSNSNVVRIQGSGMSVILQALITGTATISFTVEGVTSTPLVVSVVGVLCCQVGDGAPNSSIRQAFQAVVTRDNLSVQLPAASGVVRMGNGYVQPLLSNGTPVVPYLIAVADSTGAGYLAAGAILTQYQQLGGPTGTLGYPLADATPGGTQVFQGGALAGNPLQVVAGAILSKWKILGYETGAAGTPTGPAAAFQTFRGTAGQMQSFSGGQIVAPQLGPLAGSTFFVTGAILAQYSSGGGPGGTLGSPTGDAAVIGGIDTQYFEGGYITWTPGAAAATEYDTAREPQVIAAPVLVPAGSMVHLVAGGFANGDSVSVAQTGQPNFIVTVANGAYAWDVWVPASTADGSVVTVTATDTKTGATAWVSYAVHAVNAGSIAISTVSGDQQIGAPGALLTQPLVVAVTDLDGNPLLGQTVTFAASPGAQVTPTTVTTGAGGLASAAVSMPANVGVVLITAQAGRQVVTFSAMTAAFSLTNFPSLSQAVAGVLGNGSDPIANKGALLTAAASILRYHQLRGELPEPNGLADPVILNQFLASLNSADGFVTLGQSTEQTVNLWRLGAFVGGDLTVQVEPFTPAAVSDLVAAGSPVLLALSLSGLGSHFVVATGIASDGSIVIADPNPAFAQTNLNGYLNGFTAGGQTIQGSLVGAALLLPQAPVSPGFMAAANAPLAIATDGVACGQALQFPGVAAVAGVAPGISPGPLSFVACNGAAAIYELDVSGQGGFNLAFTDLSPNGGRTALAGTAAPSSYEIVPSGPNWTIAPLSTVLAGAVVNAASFTTQIAPGGLIAIFGEGLGSPTVQIGSQPAAIVAATPNQVNAQIPFAVPAGTAQLTMATKSGSVQQSIAISSVAPAIFSLAPGQAAIANQDGSFNSPANPAMRGASITIYATGLGAVSNSGAAATPVSVAIGGAAIPAASAVLSPGAAGLYAVKALLPSTLPPGLYLGAYLKQGSAVSNTVTVAVQ